MIEVQMGVDDDIHIVRRNARLGELFQQFRRLPVDLAILSDSLLPTPVSISTICFAVRTTTEFSPSAPDSCRPT